MWQLYKDWLKKHHSDQQPVTEHFYRDCLKAHFPQLKLSKPRTDTCKTCDINANQLKNKGLSQSEKQKVQTNQDLHLLKADRGYKLPKEIVETTGDDTMVICLDLQAVLPTPKVTAGVSFYKRKLFTLNFGIHDYKTGRGYMFVWDEVTAKRGSAEICSCIYKFVTTIVPPTTKKLYIFSDNCPGQNKNNILVLFYMFLVHQRHLEEVVHIFFRTGHTYMAADRHFGTIEKAVRKRSHIFTPSCYIDIIKSCRDGGGTFHVTPMTQDDFFDFEQLKKRCVMRSTPKGIRFSDACYFKVTKDYKIGYELAPNFLQLQFGTGYKVRLAKGKGATADKRFNLNVRPPKKYNAPIPLNPRKLEDLQDFVPGLVPAENVQNYWNKIINSSPANMHQDEDDDEAFGFGSVPDYE